MTDGKEQEDIYCGTYSITKVNTNFFRSGILEWRKIKFYFFG